MVQENSISGALNSVVRGWSCATELFMWRICRVRHRNMTFLWRMYRYATECIFLWREFCGAPTMRHRMPIWCTTKRPFPTSANWTRSRNVSSLIPPFFQQHCRQVIFVSTTPSRSMVDAALYNLFSDYCSSVEVLHIHHS